MPSLLVRVFMTEDVQGATPLTCLMALYTSVPGGMSAMFRYST